jgi:hypothetical protein
MRRGGARREVSTRVFLRSAKGSVVHEGWALNVSRGGVRAILEEKVELNEEFEVEVGTGEGPPRDGRIVWMQEEPDGVIVGIEFTSQSGTHKSVPPAAPSGAEVVSSPSTRAIATTPKADPKADNAGDVEPSNPTLDGRSGEVAKADPKKTT